MGLLKNTTILLCSCLLISGCGAPQKTVVKPTLDPPKEEKPLPPPDTVVTTGNENTTKTIVIPQDIVLPDTPDEPPQVEQIQGPLPSIEYVNDRIFVYGEKLKKWKELDNQSSQMTEEEIETLINCFGDLQMVLDGYNQLRADMLQLNTSGSTLIISSEEVMNLQKSDISFLESSCGKLVAPAEGALVNWENKDESVDLPQLETLIERYTSSREYEEVVQVWQKIPAHQIDRVHLRTKILYGNALMFLHREERAAEIYQQIVDEMSASDEQRTDLLSLRKLLADLYTASGNYLAAENQYLNISEDYKNLGSIEEWSKLQLDILERSGEGSPELVEYSKLLRNFLGFIPERDGYKIVWDAKKFLEDHPYSPVASNVDIITKEANRRAEKWFSSFFTDVERLAAEKKFLDAIEKLETIPEDIISGEQKEKIKSRNDDLILAEAVERETRKIERMQELQSRWNEGMIKVDEGDYDEAIAIFQTLLQTEYFAKARDKINALTLLAAKTDRRAAADLYVRYTKTTDVEMKKKLLAESRKLLTEILAKYPNVSIVDKVQGNIERVEQEMNQLDPTLLPEIIATEQAEKQSAEAASENMEEDIAFSQSEVSEIQNSEEIIEESIDQ